MIEPEPAERIVDFSNTEIAFSNKSNKALKRQSRLFRMMNKPLLVNIGSRIGLLAVRWNLPFSKKVIKNTIYEQFVGGTFLLECQPVIDHLNRYKTLTILDYGAEAKSDEEDLDHTLKEILKAVAFAASNASVPVVSAKITALADDDILVKKQQKEAFSDHENALWDKAKERLETLCAEADQLGVKVFIDAEESWIQETIDDMVIEMMEKYNRDKVVVYNTYQMYRHDKLAQLKTDYDKAQNNGYTLGAKLVRGAYMDKERTRAQEKNYTSPIQVDKDATDHDYNEGIKFCVERYETLASCNASHNLESNLLQANLIAEMDLPRSHPNLNFCQLYGMSDNITFNLADAGYNVAKYLPYGPVKEVVPYLIRRAQENSSVTGDMSRELGLINEEIKRRNI